MRVTAAEAYGADADKFSPCEPPDAPGGSGRLVRLRAAARRRRRRRGCPSGGRPAQAERRERHRLGHSRDVQGAFKVDKPGDNYFSSSLFYHYQLAHPTNWYQGTDFFLSGDSVGHLGGWVEGAAMSAINAVVGVCSRLEHNGIRRSQVGGSVRRAARGRRQPLPPLGEHQRTSAAQVWPEHDGAAGQLGERPGPAAQVALSGEDHGSGLRDGHRVEAGRLHRRHDRRRAGVQHQRL